MKYLVELLIEVPDEEVAKCDASCDETFLVLDYVYWNMRSQVVSYRTLKFHENPRPILTPEGGL